MARHGRTVYMIKGPAKNWVAIGVLIVVAWSLFGRSLLDADLGFFSRGYQASFLRGGHFERTGVHWNRQDVTLGTIVSFGGETALVEVDAEIDRGTVVVHAWHWPPFLYDEPTVKRARIDESDSTRLRIPLQSAGIYVLSLSGLYFGGDLTVDWRAGD
jgi:hypothetical protein